MSDSQFSSGVGGVARHKPKKTNARVDRKARNQARVEQQRVPWSVEWCLRNAKRTRNRFTPMEWVVLNAQYPAPGVKNTSRVVGQILRRSGGNKSKMLRKIEASAHQTAYELAYGWQRAMYRWHHGLPLSDWDRQMLSKHRASRSKKGRTEVIPGFEAWYLDDDVMDHVAYGADGKPFAATKRFGEMTDAARRREGIGDEYGDNR
jgi:hypothetical protein